MTRKRVVITLPPDVYDRLVALADEEERVVDQQASLLLKRFLVQTDDRASMTCRRQAESHGESASVFPSSMEEKGNGRHSS